MADLRRLGRSEGQQRVAELLDQFDLVEAATQPAATYSGGMRRRLDLAMTLVDARCADPIMSAGSVPPGVGTGASGV